MKPSTLNADTLTSTNFSSTYNQVHDKDLAIGILTAQTVDYMRKMMSC